MSKKKKKKKEKTDTVMIVRFVERGESSFVAMVPTAARSTIKGVLESKISISFRILGIVLLARKMGSARKRQKWQQQGQQEQQQEHQQ
mmetsp:Transcript_23912/g.50694  ORF Transcript_23912/g.50694 Transcript_23912/m.50694 type:complete len:88 (-) Transcript_23912:362-625(-)